MKKPRVYEEKIKRAIRDAILIDPLISVVRLQDALFEKGYRTSNNTPLDWRYVEKMHDKVHRQAIEEVDRQKLSERVAQLKERYRLAYEQLVRIAFHTDEMKKEGIPPPSTRERMTAFKEIVKLDLSIFGAEMTAGVFNKGKDEEVPEIEMRNRRIDDATRKSIHKGLVDFGIILPDGTNNENKDEK